MGILLDLLAFPVMGPFKGLIWIAETLRDRADQEVYDEGAVRGQLMELELRLDLGEIDEEEYQATEETLLARLKAIRERQADAEREV